MRIHITAPDRKIPDQDLKHWYDQDPHWIFLCWGSVTFWCGSESGSTDPHLWLMDPTPFFINFKDTPQAHHLQSKKCNFCSNFVFLLALFQSAQPIYDKREGSRAGPLTNGSGYGSGRPKNMRILRIRIPNSGIFSIQHNEKKSACSLWPLSLLLWLYNDWAIDGDGEQVLGTLQEQPVCHCFLSTILWKYRYIYIFLSVYIYVYIFAYTR